MTPSIRLPLLLVIVCIHAKIARVALIGDAAELLYMR